MASYLATNYRVGDGSTTIWNVSFAGARPDQGDGTEAYLDPDSIQAVRIDTASDGSETETPLEGTLLSPTQYEITPAVAQDVRIKVYRSSEREYPLVDFTDFASISAADLDIQARQTLYSVQELNDVILYSDKRSVAASLNAQEALDSAQAAQTDVSSAVDTANDAESIANAASSTAGSASTAASQALNTANSADGKADTAVSTANAAASDAGAAVMTANAAESKADDALAVATDITDFQGQLDDLSVRVDSLVGLDTGDLLLGSNNLNGLSNYATARSNLDVYSTTQVDTAIGQAVSNHAGEDDPHPVYAFRADLSAAASRPIGDGGTELVTNDRASSLIGDRMSSHESAPNPHPVYALKASLSEAASRPIGNGDTELVTNDRASSLIGNGVSSHESEPDPHPQYLLSEDLPEASTSTPGIVQLESSYTDTGTGTAPTSKALRDGLSNQSNSLGAHKTSEDHDDRYYTKSQVNGRYYTKSQVDGKLPDTSVGAVGTYALLRNNSNSFLHPGSTMVGRHLEYSSMRPYAGGLSGESPHGTWRCMGCAHPKDSGIAEEEGTLFLRIS